MADFSPYGNDDVQADIPAAVAGFAAAEGMPPHVWSPFCVRHRHAPSIAVLPVPAFIFIMILSTRESVQQPIVVCVGILFAMTYGVISPGGRRRCGILPGLVPRVSGGKII